MSVNVTRTKDETDKVVKSESETERKDHFSSAPEMDE